MKRELLHGRDSTGKATPIAVDSEGNIVPGGVSGASFLNIAGAATTLVKTGAGTLLSIVINKPVALGVITIYDSLTAANTKIATITNPAALLQQQLSLPYNLKFTTGLTVVTSAADDITVIYK